MNPKGRVIEDCPFCDGDIDGCCFCDHTGKIYVGEGCVFQSADDLKPFQADTIKETDLRTLFERGGLDHIKS